MKCTHAVSVTLTDGSKQWNGDEKCIFWASHFYVWFNTPDKPGPRWCDLHYQENQGVFALKPHIGNTAMIEIAEDEYNVLWVMDQ